MLWVVNNSTVRRRVGNGIVSDVDGNERRRQQVATVRDTASGDGEW
ncbi:hypothetical protein SAMN05192561_101154 [Halopenitus malekzadehii]|uniref:Uncharacterized protein n=1 Tax=Halopenitus malekzadehii TaxID=1267564 RepID=A0A1H6HTB4_9EURY|nr:hypothetical protein SAMN05192561_101154 [Halopenitus malekzadehii]